MARSFWVALHRYTGLAMLLLLLINALSGSILAYQHEIDSWLNPHLLQVSRAAQALPPDELIRRVETGDPRLRVSQFPLDAKPGEAYELRVQPRIDASTGRPFLLGFDRLFIDPANADVLGARQWGAFRLDRVHAMPFLDVLHRKLHLPGKWGMWLTGGLALTWLLALLVGTCLTLPRASVWRLDFWKRWRSAWLVKRGASTTRTVFDVHRSVGLWTFPLALVLSVSGVYFSLGDEVFKPVLRWFSPISVHPIQTLAKVPSADRRAAFDTEEAIHRARMHLVAGAQEFVPWYASHLPAQGAYRIAFKEVGMRERAGRLRYEQVFIDHQSGALLGLSGYDSGTSGDKVMIWQYPLHTGRILGPMGKFLVCLAGLATATMASTGLWIWWLKRDARRATAQRRTSRHQ